MRAQPPGTANWPLRLVRAALEGLSIRGTLYAGFTLLLVLWLAAGLDMVRRLNEAEAKAAAVNGQLVQTEDLLATIRTQVLLGSVYLRDALLDTPDTAEYYRDQLSRTRGRIDAAMAAYVPVVETPGQRASLDELKAELQDFWETVLPVLSWDATRRATEARTFLRARIIPKREVIIRISTRIGTLNRAASDGQRAEIDRIYALVRRRVWEASLELLLVGGCIAVLVTRHAGTLEARNVEAAQRLRRLSEKLVRAQEDERRTIARELHDEIGQELTGVKVELSLVERTLGTASPPGEPLRSARLMADRAIQTVRDLSQLLHPPMLDDLGLRATLEWFLVGFGRRTGIATTFSASGTDRRLLPELETCLYRIAQEATTNVARHADARLCAVRLDQTPDTVTLLVADDGRGFDVEDVLAPARRSGLGLLGIQERVAGFGGHVSIDSAVGEGTRVSVEIPTALRDEDDEIEAAVPADDREPRGQP